MSGFLEQEEARRMLDEGAVLIDVRTLPEWQEGHGPDSVLIPLDQLEARLVEIPKDQPIILCCRSGARSGSAAAWLNQQGYQAYNLGPWQRNPRCS